MIDLQTVFNAGRVRRWHTNPDMSWTDDYNDAHQGRVARIILALHPAPSIFLLAAALTHDDGELRSGDMCVDVKNTNPDVYQQIKEIEDRGSCEIWSRREPHESLLNAQNREWLKFADRLDAYMWMKHRNPKLATRPDWVEAREFLMTFAEENMLETVHGI